MSARVREIELLLLTVFAAVPLYVTQAISFGPVLLFHLAMAGIILSCPQCSSTSMRIASASQPSIFREAMAT